MLAAVALHARINNVHTAGMGASGSSVFALEVDARNTQSGVICRDGLPRQTELQNTPG